MVIKILLPRKDRERPIMNPPKLIKPARLGMKGIAKVPLGYMKTGKKEVVGVVVFDTTVAVDVDVDVTSTATEGADELVT